MTYLAQRTHCSKTSAIVGTNKICAITSTLTAVRICMQIRGMRHILCRIEQLGLSENLPPYVVLSSVPRTPSHLRKSGCNSAEHIRRAYFAEHIRRAYFAHPISDFSRTGSARMQSDVFVWETSSDIRKIRRIVQLQRNCAEIPPPSPLSS